MISARSDELVGSLQAGQFMSNHLNSPAQRAQHEFGFARLGDRRRNKRLVNIAEHLAASPGGTGPLPRKSSCAAPFKCVTITATTDRWPRTTDKQKMKSAYELAMERLNKTAPTAKLTEKQKKELAEVDSKYAAKLAERELLLKDEMTKAVEKGDYEAVGQLEKQL